MRRLLLIGVAGVLGIAIVATGFLGDEEPPSRVDAIFDTAKGIVPGQLVKVAGVRVGSIEDVSLTPDSKARLTLSVDADFAPFRADASCRILPEGLISEYFVDCDPGVSDSPLPPGPAGEPTVPVEQTAIPVSLQDVINVFSLPVSQRIGALFNELGIATAGRGEDLNALLRRANPALGEARRALSILAGERHELADAITQTDEVLASVGARARDVDAFVRNASSVARETAAHAEPLAATVRELGPTFGAVERGLGTLREIADNGAPVARRLRAAGPELTRFTKAMTPFSRTGKHAARKLGAFAREATPDVEDGVGLFRPFRAAVDTLKPDARQLALLMNSLREQGGFETVNEFFYQMASMSGGYDSVSHYVGVLIDVWVRCLLDLSAKGCSQAYSAPGNGTIPANAPSVGPQRLRTVLPAGTDIVTASEGVRMAKKRPGAVKALLEFFLK